MNVTIVGGGRVGSYLASLLLKEGHVVKVIENRPKNLQHLHNELPKENIISGKFTDPAILESANIKRADVVVVATPDDEVNLVAATLAKFEYGIKRVVARVNNPRNTWMYTPEMGVDVGITEAEIIGHALAEEMSLGDMMTLLKLQKGQFSLVQEKVHPDSQLIGKPLKDISLPSECILLAIIRNDELLTPNGDTELQAFDQVLAIARTSKLREFAQIMLLG